MKLQQLLNLNAQKENQDRILIAQNLVMQASPFEDFSESDQQKMKEAWIKRFQYIAKGVLLVELME